MTSADWISLIALAELTALLTVVLCGVGVWLLRRWRRDNAAASQLVDKVKQSDPARCRELETLLEARLGLSGAELSERALRLLANEHRFYELFIDAYLRRDSETVQRLDEGLRAVIAPYLELIQAEPTTIVVPTDTDQGDLEQADATRLRAMVRGLNDELSVYRETLNRVFSEYTAMFGVQLDATQQLSAKEIMERLASGELGGNEPADGKDGAD